MLAVTDEMVSAVVVSFEEINCDLFVAGCSKLTSTITSAYRRMAAWPHFVRIIKMRTQDRAVVSTLVEIKVVMTAKTSVRGGAAVQRSSG